jgi:hypothetical protein
MKGETIFPDRPKRGVLPTKTDSFSSRTQQNGALRNVILTNPHHLGNGYAQRFSDLWFSQRKTASIEQKDKVGRAFITKVLGLSKEIARNFANGGRGAFNVVGAKQIAIHGTDLADFWREVEMIFPDLYRENDIIFLAKYGINAVTHFLDQIEISGAERSPVLCLLAKAAQIYK